MDIPPIFQFVAAIVGSIATVYTLVRALSRSEVKLRHELEILKLHRELGIDDDEVVQRIDQLKSSIYSQPRSERAADRAIYVLSIIFNAVILVAIVSAASAAFSEGRSLAGGLVTILGLSNLLFLVASVRQLGESFVVKIKGGKQS